MVDTFKNLPRVWGCYLFLTGLYLYLSVETGRWFPRMVPNPRSLKDDLMLLFFK